MVKLQENKNRWFITLPKEYVKKKKWKKGTELLVSFNERGNIEIMDTSWDK